MAYRHQCVVLLSGGLDSLACLQWAIGKYGRENVIALYVNTCTKYSVTEWNVMCNITDKLRVQRHTVTIEFLGPLEDDIGHIPMRNVFLLETAALYGDNIVFGMLKGELSEDKGRSFVRRMNGLFSSQFKKNFYHDKTRVKIHTPFSGMNKSQLIYWLYNHSSLLETSVTNLIKATIGCLNGNFCGECVSCFNRWIALENNHLYNIDDYKTHPAAWGWNHFKTGRKVSLWKKRHNIVPVLKAYNNLHKRGLMRETVWELIKHVLRSNSVRQPIQLAK